MEAFKNKEEAAIVALREGRIDTAIELWKSHQDDTEHCNMHLCDRTDHQLICCANHFHGRLLTLSLVKRNDDHFQLAKSLGAWIRTKEPAAKDPDKAEMPVFTLSESLIIGHPTIDHDHRYLARTINDISRTLWEKDYGECQLLIDDFFDQMDRHFAKEIDILELIDYPRIDEHVRVHNELRQKTDEIREIANRIETSDIDRERLFPELVSFLLDDAIKVDLDIKTFLESNGRLGT